MIPGLDTIPILDGVDASDGIDAEGARRSPAVADATVAGEGAQTALARALEGGVFDFSCPIVGISPYGVIESWNEGAERLLGYRRWEALGKPTAMIWQPADVPEAERMLDRALAGHRFEGVPAELLAKGGAALRVEVAFASVRGAADELLGAAMMLRDVSRQASAEAEVIAGEIRYRSVVAALDEGLLVVDPEGRVSAFNESALRILRLPGHALVGACAKDLDVELLHADGSACRARELPSSLALRSGEPCRSVIGVRRRDGSVTWLAVNSRPLTDPAETRPHGAVVTFSDVTGQRRMQEELSAAQLRDLERLALVAEYRDDETSRHTERVAHSAELLAGALSLEPDLVWTIGRAAPLHDVGKVGIPDAILLKAGPLSDAEFDVMKTHTTIGARLLADGDSPITSMGREIALTHHERWDGRGYPEGRAGTDIPVCGRIVAIADAFDAMTHTRPYKEAVPIGQALAELVRCAGAQFDPDLVEAFLRLDHRTLVERKS